MLNKQNRTAAINRQTTETDIALQLAVDGGGKSDIRTGVGFLDHMLTLFARHGSFDLTVSCTGDTHVDDHHTVEDVGICLGQGFARALFDLRGVTRYGHVLLPMDEALILAAVDLSGRGHLEYALTPPTEKVGSFDTALAEELFLALTRHAGFTLHLQQLAGRNSHHILEGAFKAAARALRIAAQRDPDSGEIPSTKGVL
jgi:imidazoleglycerol-phosphate dehydratase